MAEYILRISTTQYAVCDEPIVEEAPASYRTVNGTRYISYTVPAIEDAPAVSTIICINEKSLEIRRNGGIRGNILYSIDESARSRLDLGFSCLDITNETGYYAIVECDGNLSVTVRYKLFINDSFVSDCETEILLSRII